MLLSTFFGCLAFSLILPSPCGAAESQLAASYEAWAAQQPLEQGDSTYLSAVAYLEKGIPKVQIGWADLAAQEIWVRAVELTANGRFRPLQAGVLVWSGSGRTEYQEAETALPASPNPRWIEVVLVQDRTALGEDGKLRLVIDVGATAAVQPGVLTKAAGGGGLPQKCRTGCTSVSCACGQCQASQCCGLGDNICSCTLSSCSITCGNLCNNS